jgi:hypothetical protein
MVAAQEAGMFYKEFWAKPDPAINNSDGRFLRVNDPGISLHQEYGKRPEARVNGLMLLDVPEDLFQIERAALYLELWGGHPGTADKRFTLNGHTTYPLPPDSVAVGHCNYTYPLVPLKVGDLVTGANAFQFSCDRGKTFWGHFIIDNACVRAYLKKTHPALQGTGLGSFTAGVTLGKGRTVADDCEVALVYPAAMESSIASLSYYARYAGFDDNGNLEENDWHGHTLKEAPQYHAGTVTQAPFKITWDTRMIPSQDKPMALKAVVQLKDGIWYETPALDSLWFPKKRPRVELVRCDSLPKHFWSRANQEKKSSFTLPADFAKRAERTRLIVRIWDGGEGKVAEPFTINGHAYPITSKKAVHDVVFTDRDIPVKDLQPGKNEIRLLSDTEHHGIEMLWPGPCLIVRYTRLNRDDKHGGY